MSISTVDLSARLIQVFEGCRLTAYYDRTGKRWTIGFGHTRTAKYGMVITQQEADTLFAQDCAPLLSMVSNFPVIKAAALVSFGYNCGETALRRLIDGKISIKQYGRTSDGIKLPGLIARRELEVALIESTIV